MERYVFILKGQNRELRTNEVVRKRKRSLRTVTKGASLGELLRQGLQGLARPVPKRSAGMEAKAGTPESLVFAIVSQKAAMILMNGLSA